MGSFRRSNWWYRAGLRNLLLASGIAGLSPFTWGQTPIPESAMPKKTLTRSKTFDLPILMDDQLRANVAEVHLYVKTPTTDWYRQDVGPGSLKKFTYRVQQDGEYWFSLVTVDRQGKNTPANFRSEAPGLRVVIDTAAPNVQVVPWTGDGETGLRCIIEDQHPDLSTLKVSARSDAGEVLLDPHPNQPGVFRLRPNQRNLPIRVTVSDTMGNTATKDVNPADVLAAFTPATPSIPVISNAPSGNPVPSDTPSGAGANTPLNPSPMNVAVQTNRVNLPQKPSLPEPTMPVIPNPQLPPPNTNTLPPGPAAPTPVNEPRIRNQAETPRAIPETIRPNDPNARNARPGEEPRTTPQGNRLLLNTTRANIQYRIDQVGPSGVGKVDIFLTSDQGNTWFRHMSDPQRKNPAEIDLPGEGLFGVRLAITNGNGFGGTPPRPGDGPQSWIEVDMTNPFVQIRTVEFLSQTNQIEIRWNATDKNLANDPVTIYSRTRNDGAWQAIARNHRNDGVYLWNIPRDGASNIFFKVEAIDSAGNIGRAETTNPFVLDLTEPRATVITVTGNVGTNPQN